ncbi:DNA (cytosine-5-)-methyltransferase [Listeria booriae]|uniref:DNA cytosine methyltransferase n=1 Tax=Listeria booriae TaxID=1552123 RepID=UPI001626AFFA|nr:DNA cytosine methyltransferase [Listeria booriae]MBC1913107.1 DNA (cytosine-5-)-methyltransferase [Listeria booriae]
MKFLDLFAGIGGFRLGLEQAGHECVGYVEIDKFARKSYEAIHDTKGEWTAHDITQVTDAQWRELRGTVDIITGGFPCQSFSIAGKRRGFEDTRGTLFFDIARAAEQIKPRYLFLENVRGLLSHDKGQTFATILTALHELGYDAEWCICNSKNYGVAQNRERVFVVGHLRGAGTRKIFPIAETPSEADSCRVVTDTLTTRYPYSQREGTYIETARKKSALKIVIAGKLDIKGDDYIKRIYDSQGISPALPTMQGGGQEPKIRIKEATKKGYAEASPGDSINVSHPNSKTRRGRVGNQLINRLLTGEEHAVVERDFRIRKLTPRECWRLQGFPDWAFDKAQAVNSDSQLYKQAGNSVTVPVIEAISRNF